jgi:phage antirepressor YoqD-like protein
MIYKFKEKGPAYGLGYGNGELIDIDDAKGLTARILVNEVAKDSKGNTVPTGKMVTVDKNYTVDFLIESGVIIQANAEDKKRYAAQIEAEKSDKNKK